MANSQMGGCLYRAGFIHRLLILPLSVSLMCSSPGKGKGTGIEHIMQKSVYCGNFFCFTT